MPLPADVFPVTVRRVRKRDGSIWEKTYYFHQPRRGSKNPGKRTALGTDANSVAFWQKIRQLTGSRPVFSDVVIEYLASATFLSLEQSTRDTYNGTLNRYVMLDDPDSLGNTPIDELDPSVVQGFLDGLASKPGVQQTARSIIRAIDSWAATRKKLPRQITFGTEVLGTDGGHDPWPDWAITLVLDHGADWARRAVFVAQATGQRASDLVKFRGRDLEGGGINLWIKKTKKVHWIPLLQSDLEVIKSWKLGPFEPLCPHPNGGAFNRANTLAWWWNHERKNNPALARIEELGLVMHGLRAWRVVQDTLSGLSDGDIASLRGMSEETVKIYRRLASQRMKATAAVFRLEANGTETERDHRKRFAGSSKYNPEHPKTSKKNS